MTEAILAGEQVEKLALVELAAVLTPVLAELSRLPKNLLMRNRPGDARNSETEQQQCAELVREGLIEKFWMQSLCDSWLSGPAFVCTV